MKLVQVFLKRGGFMAEKLVIASSAKEAAALKNSKSAFLAGGTEDNRLNSSVDAKTLISIGRIAELDGITKKDGSIRIGAMTTFQEMLDSSLVPDYLKDACRFMGSRTKRNMATIGGNIASKRTDSYLYPTLIASHASFELMDAKGEVCEKCACCYLKHYDELKDCLILSVSVPQKANIASKRYANTVQSHAVLTVSVGDVDGKIRVGVAAKNAALKSLCEVSEALSQKNLSDEEIKKMIEADNDLRFEKDIFGSPEYKRYLLAVTIADLAKKVKGGKR